MWQEKHIARPYEAFDSILCEALQHNIPPITLPPHHSDNTYTFPWVVFRWVCVYVCACGCVYLYNLM